MEDLKLLGETEKELQKQMKRIRSFSDDIHMEFGLWQVCKACTQGMKISSVAKFNTCHQQRNTTVWTAKKLQVTRDGGKWRCTKSTNERKIGEAIGRETKNDAEIRAEY